MFKILFRYLDLFGDNSWNAKLLLKSLRTYQVDSVFGAIVTTKVSDAIKFHNSPYYRDSIRFLCAEMTGLTKLAHIIVRVFGNMNVSSIIKKAWLS